jgi:hypothetical protein
MNNIDNNKLEKAKHQVKEIRGFYNHLFIYIVINIVILLVNFGMFNTGSFNINILSTSAWWVPFTTPFFWGIGLFFHGIKVFYNGFGFLNNWEQRKIAEIMKKEEEEMRRFK